MIFITTLEIISVECKLSPVELCLFAEREISSGAEDALYPWKRGQG
jgi:hypothetical protein